MIFGEFVVNVIDGPGVRSFTKTVHLTYNLTCNFIEYMKYVYNTYIYIYLVKL